MIWKPKTLEAALAPVAILNSIFGLNLFECPLGRVRPIFSIIYTIVCSIIYFYILTLGMVALEKNWVAYQRITFLFILWISILVAGCSVLLGWTNRKALKRLVARCAEIDDTLEPFGVEKQYEKVLYSVVHCMIIWFFFVVLLTTIDFLWLWEEVDILQVSYVTITLHLPIILNSVVDLTFVVFVRCVGAEVQRMNQIMNEVFRSNLKKFGIKGGERPQKLGKITVVMNSDARRNFIKHFVEILKQVHLEIVRLSHEINRAFWIQTLLELMVQFTLITAALYNVYFELINPSLSERERRMRMLAMALWAIVSCCKVVVINNTCTNVSCEAQQTSKIVRELDELYTDKELRDEVQQFSLQLMLHPVCFSAYGFIDLDNEFTRAFFGTVATYLVILIQMSSTPTAIKSLTQVD